MKAVLAQTPPLLNPLQAVVPHQTRKRDQGRQHVKSIGKRPHLKDERNSQEQQTGRQPFRSVHRAMFLIFIGTRFF